MKGDTCNARGDLKFGSSMKIEWKLCFFFRFLSYNCEKDRENALLRWRKMLGAREMLVNFVALPDLNYDDVSLEGAMGTSLRRCSWSGKNSYQSLLCQHMCLAYRAPSPRAWGWVLVDCGFTMVCVCVFFDVFCCFIFFMAVMELQMPWRFAGNTGVKAVKMSPPKTEWQDRQCHRALVLNGWMYLARSMWNRLIILRCLKGLQYVRVVVCRILGLQGQLFLDLQICLCGLETW